MTDATRPTPITFFITDLDPGGAERALVEIVRRLPARGWQPRVGCLSAGGALVAVLRDAGIPVVCAGAKHRWQVQAIGTLFGDLRRFPPRIVQTFLFHANLVGRFAAKLAGVPHVVSGIRVAERRSAWYLRLDRWSERLVDRHVCVSRGVAEFSQQAGRLSPGKLVVIPNGVEASRFAQARPADLTELGIRPNDRVLISVGRLDPQKGWFDLLQTAHSLAPEAPDVHWLLVGEGSLRGEIDQWRQQRGLASRVHLLGYRQDVPELLRASTGFVLASHWEGMPNALLEAMAAGLPVVSTAVEGSGELVVPGETGWLVPPSTPSALTAAVRELLANPARSQRYAQAGQAHVFQHHSWDRVADQYDRLYRELLARGG